LKSKVHRDISEDKAQALINEIYKKVLMHSSILTRIKQAEEFLLGGNRYEFLHNFSDISNPISFWEKYKMLSLEFPNQCALLYKIIGEKEAFQIIEKAVKSDGNDFKAEMHRQIEMIKNESHSRIGRPKLLKKSDHSRKEPASVSPRVSPRAFRNSEPI